MIAASAEMSEDVGVVAAGFFQGVGQHAHAVVVEMAGRQLAVVVNGLSEARDRRGSPRRLESNRAEGVAEDVATEPYLRFLLRLDRCAVAETAGCLIPLFCTRFRFRRVPGHPI